MSSVFKLMEFKVLRSAVENGGWYMGTAHAAAKSLAHRGLMESAVFKRYSSGKNKFRWRITVAGEDAYQDFIR